MNSRGADTRGGWRPEWHRARGSEDKSGIVRMIEDLAKTFLTHHCGVKLCCRLEPVSGVLRQPLGDGRRKFGRGICAKFLNWRRFAHQVRGQNGPRRGAPEYRLTGEHLVSHHGDCIDVSPSVNVMFAGCLLRRHIPGRADGHAGVGERLGERLTKLRLEQRSGHPEVVSTA